MAKSMQRNATRKKAMIEALQKSLGIVTTACKLVGIDRVTHYRWLDEDSGYAEQVEAIKDIALDFAESQLHKRMQNGSDTAIIFYLKTQGKKRGYIEKTELELSGKIELPKFTWADDKEE
jgi:hypothetical protein